MLEKWVLLLLAHYSTVHRFLPHTPWLILFGNAGQVALNLVLRQGAELGIASGHDAHFNLAGFEVDGQDRGQGGDGMLID